MELKDSQAWKNIETALDAECRAYAEYTFYGQQAKKDGYCQIQDIFFETAANELHHAKLLYKKMNNGEIPHVREGLALAKAAELAEGVDAYQEFAKTAREEGFEGLGEWFEELAKIEATHAERFQVLMDRLDNDEVFKREEVKVWVCDVCGHVHIGTEAPEKCPVCDHPQSHFALRAENY